MVRVMRCQVTVDIINLVTIYMLCRSSIGTASLNGLFLATRPLRVTPSDTGSHHVSRIDWRRGVDVTRWKGERDSFLSFVSKTLGFLPPGETPCDDDLCPYFSNLLHRFDELLSPLLTEVGLDWNLLYIDVVLIILEKKQNISKQKILDRLLSKNIATLTEAEVKGSVGPLVTGIWEIKSGLDGFCRCHGYCSSSSSRVVHVVVVLHVSFGSQQVSVDTPPSCSLKPSALLLFSQTSCLTLVLSNQPTTRHSPTTKSMLIIGKSANFDPNYFSRAKYDPNN
ncbi:hypothetical protein YC2023_000455 [Brassica napus]